MENKKLYRSRKQSVISGVCGGIGEYFNIDPVIVRVLWVVIGLSMNGTGIFLYIIAAIVIPKEPKKIKISPEPYPFEENADNQGDTADEIEATKKSYTATSSKSPVESDDRNTIGMVIGLLLIFVGGFVLVMNLFDLNLNFLLSLNFNYIRIFAKYFWPICLILLGLVFFVKSK